MPLQLPALSLLIFLQLFAVHLGAGPRLPKVWLALGLVLLQGMLAWRLDLAEASPLSIFTLLFLVFAAAFPIFVWPLPRRGLVVFGYLVLALLLGITFWVRAELGVGFDFARVVSELPFTARYNWGNGLVPWLRGFFQDDFLKFFWWALALFVVAAAFVFRVHAGPRERPISPAKQLPLYAPRRSARKKRR